MQTEMSRHREKLKNRNRGRQISYRKYRKYFGTSKLSQSVKNHQDSGPRFQDFLKFAKN